MLWFFFVFLFVFGFVGFVFYWLVGVVFGWLGVVCFCCFSVEELLGLLVSLVGGVVGVLSSGFGLGDLMVILFCVVFVLSLGCWVGVEWVFSNFEVGGVWGFLYCYLWIWLFFLDLCLWEKVFLFFFFLWFFFDIFFYIC